MKKILAVVLIAFSLNGFAQQKELVWHTDVNKAINISVKSGKPLFFFFTGSDWCSWCKRLQREVFFKPEFTTWANKNVVLVELDFPKRKKLDEVSGQDIRALEKNLSKTYDAYVNAIEDIQELASKEIDRKAGLKIHKERVRGVTRFNQWITSWVRKEL